MCEVLNRSCVGSRFGSGYCAGRHTRRRRVVIDVDVGKRRREVFAPERRPRMPAVQDRYVGGRVDSTRHVKGANRGHARASRSAHVDCAAVPLPGSPTVAEPVSDLLTRPPGPRRIGLFGGTFDPPARRPPRDGGQRAPRPRARRRGADGGQRALAEGGQPADHAGRGPPGDGRGRGRRRRRPGGRAPGDRPRRAELHRRHAGHPGRAASRAPSCSRSSATTPPPGSPPGSATRRSSPARRWSSSTAPARPSSCRPTSPWIHVEVPRLEVSSTDLRARFVDGRPLDYLVTDPVLDIIERNQLYGRAA